MYNMRDPKNGHVLSIKALDQKNHKKLYETLTEDERQTADIDFGDNSDTFIWEYLDRYEGVQPAVLNMTRFDDNTDLSMTYLGRTDMTRTSKVKAEETFLYQIKGIQKENC